MPLILLVEDEAIILDVLAQELKDAGFEVTAFSSGAQALAELERDWSQFACLVTDVDLGKGPTGWVLAHRARELNHAFPIIYMSGRRAIDWAGRRCARKHWPFAAAQLISAITRSCSTRSALFSRHPRRPRNNGGRMPSGGALGYAAAPQRPAL